MLYIWYLGFLDFLSPSPILSLSHILSHTNTQTHTHTYTHILDIFMSIFVFIKARNVILKHNAIFF